MFNNETVAVKKLHVSKDDKIEDIHREFRREVWLSSSLRHPCIVGLKGFSYSPLSMAMEICAHGDLFEYLSKRPAITWQTRLKLAKNIADALQFLHGVSPKICHRDIKSPNVLVSLYHIH